MYSLGIDTSNYATSLAIYDTEGQTSPVMLKRFLPVRAGALGLRQSDAVFHHTAALPELFEELKKKTNLKELSAVGVSVKPRPVEGSYMPCFLVGRAAACAIGAATGIPVVETSHSRGILPLRCMPPAEICTIGRRWFFIFPAGQPNCFWSII